jgi:LysR family transcriptional regulator, regulator for bpeEF and oprC
VSSLRLLLTFAEAARRASFAAAARELGLSPSAVAKGVARLEEDLDLRLFQRTTRRIALTQEGEELYERCKRVLDELGELEQMAASATAVPAGVLRIDVPVTYGKQVLVPVLTDLARRHPGLRLDVQLSDRYADVIGVGLDAVVRIGGLDDSGLVARVFDWQHLGVYGAPGYLRTHGRPRVPADLAKHDCLAFRMPSTGRLRPWQFATRGQPVTLTPADRYCMNDGEGIVAAAIAGLGLAQVPDYMAAPAVAVGRLEELMVRHKPKPLPIALVYPTRRHLPLRLRVLIDALVALDRAKKRA